MDALMGTIEVIEPSMNFAGSMRQDAMKSFAPLGPPDLVTVKKQHIPSYGKTSEQTYYHFVRGYHVSSEEGISAYLAGIVNAGFRSGSWYQGGRWKVTKLWYSAFCAMNCVDIVVAAEIPGGVTVTALDADGREVDVTPAMWKDCELSAACRHICGIGEAKIYPCMKVFNMISDREKEEELLRYALELQNMWHLTGTDRSYKKEGSRSSKGCADSRVASALYAYFAGYSRFHQAVEFFLKRAAENDPECAVYAAKAINAMGDHDKAISVLEDVLDVVPDSMMACCTMLESLCLKGDFEGANDFYESHTEEVNGDSLALVQLALCHAKSGEFEKALVRLNLAEMPTPTLDPFLRELIPAKRCKMTHEPSKDRLTDLDAVRVLSLRLKEEKGPGIDKNLNDLPARMMTEMDHQAYHVLVTVLNALGWEGLLAVRSRCFIMREDVERRMREIAADVNSSLDAQPGDVAEDADGPAETGATAETEAGGDTEQCMAETPTAGDEGPEADDETPRAVNESPQAASTSQDEKAGDSTNRDEAGNAGGRPTLEQMTNKSLCQPWFDYLVMTMFEDLQCKGQLMVELRENEENVLVESIVSATNLSAVDWLRRGDLAKRLLMPREAAIAYTVSVQLAEKGKKTSIAPHLELLKLAADEADVPKVLKEAAAVINMMNLQIPHGKHNALIAPVRKALFSIVTKVGLRSVRELQRELDSKGASLVQEVLLDAVDWHVYRFDE